MRAVVLLSGGLDSYTAAAIAKAQRLHAVRADRPLRPAARARGRGGARGRARARRRAAPRARRRPARDRRLVAHVGRRGAARSRPRRRRHSVDLRAGAQHDLPVARARLGRGRSARATSSSASTRSTIPAIPTAGRSSSRAFERLATLATRAGVEGAPVSRAHAAHRAQQGRDHPARPRARPRLRPDAQLLRSRRPTGGPAARCDSCVLRAKGFREAGVPDPLLLR